MDELGGQIANVPGAGGGEWEGARGGSGIAGALGWRGVGIGGVMEDFIGD